MAAIALKKRSEIDNAFKWKIEDLFPTDAAWERTFEDVKNNLAVLEQYRGKLSDMALLLACLRDKDAIAEKAEKVYVYATMKMHEDSGNSKYQGMADQAESLLIKLMSAVSFVDPEILSIDPALITQAITDENGLVHYKHMLDDLTRVRAHVLTPELEEMLANAGEIGQAADNIYAMLVDADMKFGTVTDDDGNDVTLTQGKYISLMESVKRDVRKNTFKTYYDAFIKQKNTLAATYSASVKKDVFFSNARKYGSALEGALSNYNIPKAVYTNLIAATHESLPLLHQYIRLRQKLLGLSDLHMYDLYTPMIKEANTTVTYDEAKATVLRALAPLGEDYVAKVREALQNGWVDVYENEGKRGGAYAWGAYGTHPYMLLNYDNKVGDMFTLAHEIGHAMHSHYSWTTQPYTYGDYTIFVAEVASTVNECLLMDYLLKTTTDKAQKQYLLNYYLEQFRGTMFRQTMFAEFEMKTHDMVENGEPLTVDSLCALYRALNIQYYGPDIVMDTQVDMEWSRIPHFYSAFYVYQYATGFSAAVALSRGILENGQAAVDKYRTFLCGGSSDYSINLLKAAGVDMSRPEPVRDAMRVFGELLNEMEKVTETL